jgi:hypothetical protein
MPNSTPPPPRTEANRRTAAIKGKRPCNAKAPTNKIKRARSKYEASSLSQESLTELTNEIRDKKKETTSKNSYAPYIKRWLAFAKKVDIEPTKMSDSLPQYIAEALTDCAQTLKVPNYLSLCLI